METPKTGDKKQTTVVFGQGRGGMKKRTAPPETQVAAKKNETNVPAATFIIKLCEEVSRITSSFELLEKMVGVWGVYGARKNKGKQKKHFNFLSGVFNTGSGIQNGCVGND